MNNLAYENQSVTNGSGNHLKDNFNAAYLSVPRLETLLKTDRLVSNHRVVTEKDSGELLIQTPNSTNCISDPKPPCIPSNPAIPVLVLGIGNGKIVDGYLSQIANPILVIEPEIDLLGEILKRYDWQDAIERGQLRLQAPDLNNPIVAQISMQECVAEIQHQMLQNAGNAYWVVSGSFSLNRPFYNSLEKSVSFFAEFSNFVADCFETVDQTEAVDVAVISPQCRIFDDVAHCFRQLGLKTRLYQVPDAPGKWRTAEWRNLYRQMWQTPCKATVFRNRSMLEAERATERYNWDRFLPGQLVSWWWDNPTVTSQIDLDYQTENNVNLAFAKDMLGQLPPRSEWLPPGALTPFSAYPVSLTDPPKPDLPTTFVGQSRLQLIITNLKILHQSLGHFCGQAGGFLSTDIERKHNILELYTYIQNKHQEISSLISGVAAGRPKHAYYLDYIFQMILTGLFRMAAVLSIRKAGLPVLVFGDDGWLKSGVVDEAAFKGLVAPANLPELYQRSAVNLNLNFMQVSSTVNPKVLDACAAGGCVLTDYRPELADLFPDPETRPFYFQTLQELPEKLDILLRSDLTEHRLKLLIFTRRTHSLMGRVRHLARRLNLLPRFD